MPVRIVAATNANLDDLVEDGRFRRDLFYRLSVARLTLPPLRERKDEIPALASLFLTRCSRECHRTGVRLADDLIAALLLYDWPGNIRQLSNEIRRIAALADDGQLLHSQRLDAGDHDRLEQPGRRVRPWINRAARSSSRWTSRSIARSTSSSGPSSIARCRPPAAA